MQNCNIAVGSEVEWNAGVKKYSEQQIEGKSPAPPGTRPSTIGSGVIRIACLLLIVLCCLTAAHFLINTGLRRIQTGWFGVMNRVVSGKVNADIVITGSSRALVHYDPRIIQKKTGLSVFNLGLNGSQTDMQLALLKCYLQHNRPPKLLIHNLDSFSLQVTHGGVYDPGQYIPYLGEPALYEALGRINPDIWKSRYLPLYGYAVEDMRFTWIRGIKGLLGWFPPEDRFSGFTPRFAAWTGDFDQFKMSNPGGVSFEIEPEGVRNLAEIGELCRREGIPMLFVYSPEYNQMQAMERNRGEIFARFRDLADRSEAPFWDFSSSPICGNRALFYNSQHLNAEGALAFSNEFAELLIDKEWNWMPGRSEVQP